MDKKEISFESAIKRLESIASELERAGTDLDTSLKLYEEGIGLVRYCNATLENAERKVKLLTVDENGEFVETDFLQEAQQ